MDDSTNSLRGLFEAALALPPDARAAFLSVRCADENMRARIETLLAADAGVGEPLEQASAEQLARKIGEIDDDVHLTVGARIGPFELLEVLGEGGSSTVFRAQRENDGVIQQVALKLLHRNMHAPDAQRRFRAERKVLAQLQHPGIARLIEGGVTDDGLGYIALELVDGVPITEYARKHKLNLRARLHLFVQACAAVAASHRALIVHRDLKPSNVLVTPEGEVKLLDFGIAKLLDDDTLTAVPAFTPAYAAPEQRNGGPISTATDVYALGVLLGELITGKRLDGSSGHTPSGQIAENTEPGVLPASAHITRRQLRGDLDTIVLKAIDTEPERRYASASALADDVNRLLVGQPVSAHPPTRWYRTQKFVARHRGGVVTTAAFLLAIFAALGLALWQTNVARHEAQRANSVRAFLLDVFNAAKPAGPRLAPPSVADVVNAGIAEAQRSTVLDRGVRIELISTLGTVMLEQGEIGKSVAVLKDNYNDAVRSLGRGDPATLQAGLALSRAYMDDGSHNTARSLLDLLQRHSSKVPMDLHARLVATSAALATHQFSKERALAESAVAMTLCNERCSLQTRSFIALMRGSALASFHDDPAAIAPMQQALALQRELHGGPHVDVAAVLQKLSRVQRRMGNLVQAEALARESLEIVEASVPDPHVLRSNALDTLRQVLIDRRELDQAIALGKRITAMDITTLGDQHPSVATSYNTQGFTYQMAGRYAEAAQQYRAALSISEQQPDNARRTAIYRSNVGNATGLGGDPAAGIQLVRQAIEEFRAQPEPDLSEICSSLEKIGRLHRVAGDLVAAEASYRQTDAIYRNHLPNAPPNWHVVTLVGLGRTLADAGDNAQAITVLREALALETRPETVVSSNRIEAKAALAEVLYRSGDVATARDLLAAANAEALKDNALQPYLTQLLRRASVGLATPVPAS